MKFLTWLLDFFGPPSFAMQQKAAMDRLAEIGEKRMTSINGQPPLVDMSADTADDNRPRYSTRRLRQEIERAKQQERQRCIAIVSKHIEETIQTPRGPVKVIRFCSKAHRDAIAIGDDA